MSGKIKTCSDLDGADFIVGDPSHPNFQAKHSTEGRTILRPVPAIVILPDDSWGDKVNSVLKNPMYDIRGVFRASRLYASVRDADELGNFWEVMKTLLRQILRRNGLKEEDFSKPIDWKAKISDSCGTEFMSLFSTPAMQKMSAQYKDAILKLDDPFLRNLRGSLGSSENLRERCREIMNFFDTNLPGHKNSYHVPSLLLLGETGCGKSLLSNAAANVIMPDIKLAHVNISSYDTNSIDIMLFGAESGSYTSSDRDRLGLFIGHCGEVVFLDEIGDMNLESQTRLLTYMDNSQVLPRGMGDSVCSPCILIAATNKNVKDDKNFRRDILSRFDHVIEIPSLSERKKDIRLLASMILQDSKINPEAGTKRKVERISLDAINYLEGRDYPGNFRELKFCISQAVNNSFSEGSECLCLRHFLRH
ncbi:MAG: sigma 54-interacting transcriptional regulator [Synergistaceae bacterium]|nr:sigma 54-interacting transcriptional regulator [Synergistaceae bacterium]